MDKTKLVVLDGYAANPGDMSWEAVEELCDAQIYERTPKSQTVERLQGTTAALTNKTVLDREVLSQCPELKFIGVLATGYNIVDTEFAAQQGITVCNVPAYSTESVVQLTFALLLECCSRVGVYSRSVAAGDWCKSPDFTYMLSPIQEICGKKLGIIGYGTIGRRVGEVARAFGLQVMAYSRSLAEKGAPEGIEAASVERILSECDVITLHCPATPQTTRLIDKNALNKVKRGTILLNTARGVLVDEQAVADALKDGRLSFYAADVAAVEPMPADCPLLGLENCIFTPHIAWATREARARLMNITVENLKAFLAGKPINKVN